MAVIEFTTEELESEEWRPVVGYEGYYSVSSLGRVRNDAVRVRTYPGKIINSRKGNGRIRYWRVTLNKNGKRTFSVHVLVALAFLGPRPDGYTVNHEDGDKDNNRASNLNWMTHAEQIEHAKSLGLFASGDRNPSRLYPEKRKRGDDNRARQRPAKGEDNGNAKLTSDQVMQMRAEHQESHTSYPALAMKYGIHKSMVYHIINRHFWKHI